MGNTQLRGQHPGQIVLDGRGSEQGYSCRERGRHLYMLVLVGGRGQGGGGVLERIHGFVQLRGPPGVTGVGGLQRLVQSENRPVALTERLATAAWRSAHHFPCVPRRPAGGDRQRSREPPGQTGPFPAAAQFSLRCPRPEAGAVPVGQSAGAVGVRVGRVSSRRARRSRWWAAYGESCSRSHRKLPCSK